MSSPPSGKYYVMVRAYSTYSGVSLLASYAGATPTSAPTTAPTAAPTTAPTAGPTTAPTTAPNPPNCTELSSGVTVTISGYKDSEKLFCFDNHHHNSTIYVKLSGGSGDADLYVKYGSKPTE